MIQSVLDLLKRMEGSGVCIIQTSSKEQYNLYRDFKCVFRKEHSSGSETYLIPIPILFLAE